MDTEVLAVVGGCTDSLRKSVSWIPVNWEVDASVVRDAGVANSVLAQTRIGICSNGVALLAISGLRAEVGGVCGTENIETVTVICSNDDQGVFKLSKRFEFLDSGLDGVIHLE